MKTIAYPRAFLQYPSGILHAAVPLMYSVTILFVSTPCPYGKHMFTFIKTAFLPQFIKRQQSVSPITHIRIPPHYNTCIIRRFLITVFPVKRFITCHLCLLECIRNRISQYFRSCIITIGRTGLHNHLFSCRKRTRPHSGIHFCQQANRSARSDMSLLIFGIRIFIHHTGCLLQQTYNLRIHIRNRTTRLVIAGSFTDSDIKQRNFTICTGQQEIRECFLKIKFSQRIPFYFLIRTGYFIYIMYGYVCPMNQIITTRPNRSRILVRLKVSRSQITESPVRPGYIIGIKFQATWKTTITKHIVSPFTIYSGQP